MKKNNIHPTAIIGENTLIGNNTKIMAGVYIGPNVIIGDNCTIYPYAIIGTNAQYKDKIYECNKKIIIKDNVVIREFTTIHHPSSGKKTEVGNNCYLMTSSHVAHDCILSNDVTLCNNVALGGHTTIGKFTTIGLNTSVHQRSKIGDYCMIGANSFFKGHSPDGITWIGSRAKPIKVNYHALEKYFDNLCTHSLSELGHHKIEKNALKFISEYNKNASDY